MKQNYCRVQWKDRHNPTIIHRCRYKPKHTNGHSCRLCDSPFHHNSVVTKSKKKS